MSEISRRDFMKRAGVTGTVIPVLPATMANPSGDIANAEGGQPTKKETTKKADCLKLEMRKYPTRNEHVSVVVSFEKDEHNNLKPAMVYEDAFVFTEESDCNFTALRIAYDEEAVNAATEVWNKERKLVKVIAIKDVKIPQITRGCCSKSQHVPVFLGPISKGKGPDALVLGNQYVLAEPNTEKKQDGEGKIPLAKLTIAPFKPWKEPG